MVLVTGSTGHVGNVLVRTLVSQKERVRAMVLPGESLESLKGLDVEIVEADVLIPESVEPAMESVDLVYHLAGMISILPGAESRMWQVNVEGTANVAEAALRAGARMVHTSSVHAFRREPHGRVMDESTPFADGKRTAAYDHTKAEGARRVKEAVQRGLDAVIVCPSGIIGPYDYLGSEMGRLIASFSGRSIHFLVDGSYDFVDVRDVADGLILAAKRGLTGETYILSGTQVALDELREITQGIVGIHSPRCILPSGMAMFLARFSETYYRLSQTAPRFTQYSIKAVLENSCFSRTKAETEIGYRCRPLHDTISDFLVWKQDYSWKRSKASQ